MLSNTFRCIWLLIFFILSIPDEGYLVSCTIDLISNSLSQKWTLMATFLLLIKRKFKFKQWSSNFSKKNQSPLTSTHCVYVLMSTKGPPWPWSYGSLIYNYLCKQCIFCEFESRSGRGVQHVMKKSLSVIWQFGGFLGVLSFLPIKLTVMI